MDQGFASLDEVADVANAGWDVTADGANGSNVGVYGFIQQTGLGGVEFGLQAIECRKTQLQGMKAKQVDHRTI